jgi:hypothetical protein
MDGRKELPDFDIQVTSNDSPWKTIGQGWLNEDGSILFGIEWAHEGVMFMVVKKEATDGVRRLLENPRGRTH